MYEKEEADEDANPIYFRPTQVEADVAAQRPKGATDAQLRGAGGHHEGAGRR